MQPLPDISQLRLERRFYLPDGFKLIRVPQADISGVEEIVQVYLRGGAYLRYSIDRRRQKKYEYFCENDGQCEGVAISSEAWIKELLELRPEKRVLRKTRYIVKKSKNTFFLDLFHLDFNLWILHIDLTEGETFDMPPYFREAREASREGELSDHEIAIIA